MRAASRRPPALESAVAHLRAGGLVAYPTETVWGLAADASRPGAAAALRAWKRTPSAQPIALLVAGFEDLERLGIELPETARSLAAAFWPGPLTLVVPGPARVDPELLRADGAVGLRCSPHPVARALAQALAEAGVGPATATSLNRHGEPPARTREEAARLCRSAAGPRLLDLPGPDAGSGPPSTVVEVTRAQPRLLREGAIPAERIAAVASP